MELQNMESLKRPSSGIINSLLKTPKRSSTKSLPPARVLVDRNGNGVSKKPRPSFGTPQGKEKTPLPKVRSNIFSPKVTNIPSTPKQDDQIKSERSQFGSVDYQDVDQDDNDAIKDTKSGTPTKSSDDKENTPIKKAHVEEQSCSRTPSLSLKGLMSEWARMKKRDSTLLSPAVRVEIKETKDSAASQMKTPASKLPRTPQTKLYASAKRKRNA
eukprot:TRINITY_DN8772_c0_g1_i1.p1 TRINITY_DN8772_c0_g1~~TRINITY_DN8772_c0_g1_i1.p1  ORF type:complete len:214 (-),score=59.14 TRINITY_DN8772_c0_g1_i1:155-796(-)